MNPLLTFEYSEEKELIRAVPQLANVVAQMDYHSYQDLTEKQITKYWKRLQGYTLEGNEIAAVNILGIPILMHFIPQYYDSIDHYGRSIKDFWNNVDLQTSIYSYFTHTESDNLYLNSFINTLCNDYGLILPHIQRPQIVKAIINKYKPNIVFDPCAGYGSRMLAAMASDTKFIGFEPNFDIFYNMYNMIEYFDKLYDTQLFSFRWEEGVNLLTKDIDMIMCSPPDYFEHGNGALNLNGNSYSTIEAWQTEWLGELISKTLEKVSGNAVSCWQVPHKHRQLITDIHKKYGYELKEQFTLKHMSGFTDLVKNKDLDNYTDIYIKI